MTDKAQRSKFPLFSQIFLIGYALVVGWAIFNYMILPSGPFGWDQAAHSVIASLVAQDISDGNWLAFFYDLYRQVYWPPIHPFLLGTTFAIGGVNPIIARSLSLLLFLGSALLIYFAGLKLNKERGYRTAFITTVLFLTSTGLLPFAGQVMLEMTAVFFFILTLLLFFHIDDKSSSWLRIALGLVLVTTYLAKSNYGILLFITLFIELLIEARWRPRKFFSRANLVIALPVIILLAIWFAYPVKILRTWAALVNIPFGVAEPYSIEGLLFYPKALWQSSGHLFFMVLFVASLILVIIKKYRDKNLRFLVLLIIFQLIIAQLHQTKVARHILTVLPPFFLLTGYVLANQGFDFNLRGRHIRLSLLLTIVTLLSAQLLLVNALQPVAPQAQQVVAQQTSDILSDRRPSLVISTINQLNPNPPLLEWSLISGEAALNPVHADIAMNYDQDNTIAALTNRPFIPQVIRDWIGTAVRRQEQPGLVRTVYLDNSGSSYSQNPQALSRYLQTLNDTSPVERVIVVIPEDVQRSFIPAGTTPFTSDFYLPGLENLGLERVSTQVFEQQNTRVEIYE